MDKTRIFIVDDHPLVREWLILLLQQQPDMEVCGEAEDAPTAIQLMAERRPELVMLDLTLKLGSGLELIKHLRQAHPEAAVLVLSMHDERSYAERALRAGARGYIMKSATAKRVIEAVRHVLAGRVYMSDQLASVFAERFVGGRLPHSGSLIDSLTDREVEVFQLLGRGHETRKIATLLGVSMKTVQAHCSNIKEKLKLANGAELLREAVRWHEATEVAT